MESSREWSSVGAWSQGASPAKGNRSAASLPCCAGLRVSVGKAGERSPARDRMVRGGRASGRPEQTQRNGRALKRASTLKEQKPVRSSEASSDRPEPPGHTAGAYTNQVARLQLPCRRNDEGLPSESPRRWQVTSPASRSLCGLHSSVNY